MYEMTGFRADTGPISSTNKTIQSNSNGAADDRVNVMVVDDALVIRGMLTRILEAEPDLHVTASVGDGKRAIDALDRYDIDVVVLDIEMPVMDGLEALPQLIRKAPGIQVLMASTLTRRNAEISMKALELGAADYVPKPTSSGELNSADDFKRDIVDKVRALGPAGKRARLRRAGGGTTGSTVTSGRGGFRAAAKARHAASHSSPAATKRSGTVGLAAVHNRHSDEDNISLRPGKIFKPEVIAIGSSTGGPQALFKMLRDIGGSIPQPILITQHMPPTFTTILAEHISKSSGLPAAEGIDGEVIEGGRVYIAPGGFHMLVEARDGVKRIKLSDGPPENFCKPAADPMLRSIASAYGGKILGLILTGMGVDGEKGSAAIVKAGGQIIAQDKQSSVVWGMPGAVSMAGLCTAVIPLDEIGGFVRKYALGASL
jgi:two-component system chemotaxis response regulator CheB